MARRYTPERLRQMRGRPYRPFPPETCEHPACATPVSDAHAFCPVHFQALPRLIRDRLGQARSRWVQAGKPDGYADVRAAYVAAIGWAVRTLRKSDEQE